MYLRAGEWVEVRSQEEILDTLDERGCLENLPFMPEMLQFCGKRYRVYKRADRTCDTISGQYKSRRMYNTVHLSDLRCDGDAHGGCDTTCLLYWKEAWLKRVVDGENSGMSRKKNAPGNRKCSAEDLLKATRGTITDAVAGEDIYSCQATELLKASYPVSVWDIRQYLREWTSGNVSIGEAIRYLSIALYNNIINIRGVGRFHYILTGYRRYPVMKTQLFIENDTPREVLNLKPGELVEVKEIEEILKTLKNWRNKGLTYDSSGEMLEYCGKKMKVLKRVRKVIDEKTGRLNVLKNESVILEGAICCGHYSPNRLLCPRSLYPFWREIWLKRVGD